GRSSAWTSGSNVRYRDGGGTGELNRKTYLPSLRGRVGVEALLAFAVLVSACGQSRGSGVGATATAAAPAPSVATLTAIGQQLFPLVPQFGYYTTCVNLPERGAPPLTGNDYSAWPLTDAMRARLAQTNAPL